MSDRSIRTVRHLAALAVLLTAFAAVPAHAHHGFDGRYDTTRPLYVEGVLEEVVYGYPHAEMLVRILAPAAVPADLAALPVEQVERLGGAEVLERLQVADLEGTVELVFPPPMTGELSRLAERPAIGARVGAVVFAECDTGELRVQLLRLAPGEHLIRGGVVQREIAGCPGAVADEVHSEAYPTGGDERAPTMTLQNSPPRGGLADEQAAITGTASVLHRLSIPGLIGLAALVAILVTRWWRHRAPRNGGKG